MRDEQPFEVVKKKEKKEKEEAPICLSVKGTEGGKGRWERRRQGKDEVM